MLRITNLSKQFDNTPVLNDISLSISEGEILCLLGKSGCGKTTLLRTIVGLEQPDSGRIYLSDVEITNFPVHQRKFGLMFQEFALFPHMNVAENIQFGLRMAHLEQKERQNRLQDVLKLVQLSGYEKRDVSQLSGGEKQRVALARSLAPSPKMLMLDEPLGSLDASLRKELGLELRKIIKSLGLTAIYVTHDQQEAFTIADRVAVMNAGRIEQAATPRELYTHPKSVFVAEFLGLHNLIPVHYLNERSAVSSFGEFPVDADINYILIHPRSISIASEIKLVEEDIILLEGVVTQSLFLGEYTEIKFKCIDDMMLSFSVPSDDTPKSGDKLTITINRQQIIGL